MADSTSDENKSPQPHTSAISEESQSPNPRSGLIAISQKSRGTESDVDDLTQELKRRPVKQRARKNPQPKKRFPDDMITLMHSTELLIPRKPFERVVREVMENFKCDCRITKVALDALHESSELYLIQLMQDGYLCALHRQRVTLTPDDIQLVRILRGPTDTGNN